MKVLVWHFDDIAKVFDISTKEKKIKAYTWVFKYMDRYGSFTKWSDNAIHDHMLLLEKMEEATSEFKTGLYIMRYGLDTSDIRGNLKTILQLNTVYCKAVGGHLDSIKKICHEALTCGMHMYEKAVS
jgi:hypothetical protein